MRWLVISKRIHVNMIVNIINDDMFRMVTINSHAVATRSQAQISWSWVKLLPRIYDILGSQSGIQYSTILCTLNGAKHESARFSVLFSRLSGPRSSLLTDYDSIVIFETHFWLSMEDGKGLRVAGCINECQVWEVSHQDGKFWWPLLLRFSMSVPTPHLCFPTDTRRWPSAMTLHFSS